MVVLKVWSAGHVLGWIKEGAAHQTFGTVKFSVSTARLRLFKHSRTCARCGIKGSVFILERFKEQTKGWHLNLYAKNKNGHLILMTKDHVIPRAKGGPDCMANYQTMCRPCNSKKGDSVEIPKHDFRTRETGPISVVGQRG